MINVEELSKIVNDMQDYKSIKAIKVTTRVFDYLEMMTRLAPYYGDPHIKPHAGDPAYLRGIHIIIDDEIEGYYEIVY